MAPSRLLRVVPCVVAAALIGVVPATVADAGLQARSMLHYGDSLAVGTGIYLPEYLRGWSLIQSSDVSRHADSAPAGIAAYGASLPRVVVISLGANDSPADVAGFSRTVREVVRVAGPTRCVVWASIVRPPYNGISYAGMNAALRRLDARFRNLVVFDWARLATRNPHWFGSDGVHPTAHGYRARAAAIARLVRADC